MSNDKSVLPNGFGYPYVSILTVAGDTITVLDQRGNRVNISELVTSFDYQYNEETDDSCTIKLHMPVIQSLNHDLFREDQKFKVNWGYVLPRGIVVKGPNRTIAVRDISTNYRSDGIDIELTCTDLVSYLRDVRLNRSSKSNNFEDWLKEILEGKYIPSITIQGKTTILKTDAKAETYKQIAGISNLHAEYEADKTYWGKSKAITAEIEERLGQSTKGPLYLDGRDDVLEIKDRNYNQAPYKGYTYAGGTGELIEFRSKSNILASRDNEAEEAIIDDVTKSIAKTKAGNNADYDDGKNDPDKVKAHIRNNSIIGYYKKKFQEAVDNPAEQPNMDTIYFKETVKFGGTHSSTVNVDGNTRVATGRKTVTYENQLASKQILNSPDLLRARRVATLRNYIMKKVERKYEATCRVLGDPSIISSKIYNFSNMSDRDSGNWYCVSASHSITPGTGYITTMELAKKPIRLASLLEQRDDPINADMNSEPIVSYVPTNTINDNSLPPKGLGTLNYEDITSRVAEQVAFTEFLYAEDNNINNYKKPPITNSVNSQDV